MGQKKDPTEIAYEKLEQLQKWSQQKEFGMRKPPQSWIEMPRIHYWFHVQVPGKLRQDYGLIVVIIISRRLFVFLAK